MVDVMLFRRDLRLWDNTALAALAPGPGPGPGRGSFVPAFIVDPAQADPAHNPYHSPRAARFMAESLADLEQVQLRRPLVVVVAPAPRAHAAALDLLQRAVGGRVRRLAYNADVTPYAKERDAEVRAWCAANDVECIEATGDYSLVDPRNVRTADAVNPGGGGYRVFAPFARRYLEGAAAGARSVPRDQSLRGASATAASLAVAEATARFSKLLHGGDGGSRAGGGREVHLPGGRTAALRVLDRLRAGAFSRYDATRDDLGDEDGTTRLSAYLKFGCVSVREALRDALAGGGSGAPALARQLMFRAFYDQIVHHYPQTLAGQLRRDEQKPPVANASLRPAYDAVRWDAPGAQLLAWKQGRTGVPLVDAAMRQLEATGYMHNRARMLVASFLVKDLHVDWRHGERHFATRLVDYDPASNNQGWTFISGGGADAQPFTRTFSPWRQARQHDPQARYVLRWLPEVRRAGVPAADLLRWDEPAVRGRWAAAMRTQGYPADPIVADHTAAARRAKERVLAALGRRRTRVAHRVTHRVTHNG